MCGMCGIFNIAGESVQAHEVAAMTATLQHRGPDDEGVYATPDGQVGLGNRRLAIIDLSPAGHQPMSNEDGSVWIAYNGEVYNFAELRQELLAAGHVFRSHTDTEVLIHLYEEVGERLVERLRGMFAFAIWDAHRERLLLARDRLGIKPLYYAQANGRLLFASEIKALLASGQVRPALNRDALTQYLALGYVAPPDTLFAGIRKLEPGHILVADAAGQRVQPYWDIYDAVTPKTGLSEAEAIDLTLAKLEEAVRMRLVADVPVGVFLSGGIDSSLVAALAARHSDHPVRTFTLGFKDHPEYNEIVYARRVAGYLGAEAHEILIGPEDVQAFFPRFLDFQEEPAANPIWFATYFVSQLARDNGVIVVLSGDGGDELFAGYNRWMDYLRLYDRGWRQLPALPHPLRQMVGALSQRWLPRESQRETVRRGVAGEELFWGGTAFKPRELAAMLNEALRPNGHLWAQLPLARWQTAFKAGGGHDGKDYLAWMAYASLKGTLLEDYLMRLDKMGMAASIEGRVPMLDHEFVALSLSLPTALKYPGYRNKHLLREVARRVLPSDVVDRRKTGFCAPVDAWVSEVFADELAAGLALLQSHEHVFEPTWLAGVVERLRQGHVSAASDWALLALGQWYRRWIAP